MRLAVCVLWVNFLGFMYTFNAHKVLHFDIGEKTNVHSNTWMALRRNWNIRIWKLVEKHHWLRERARQGCFCMLYVVSAVFLSALSNINWPKPTPADKNKTRLQAGLWICDSTRFHRTILHSLDGSRTFKWDPAFMCKKWCFASDIQTIMFAFHFQGTQAWENRFWIYFKVDTFIEN